MQPRQWSFCWIFRYILHSMAKTITFLKGNLCTFLNVSYTFYKFFSSALKKNYKMCPDLRWILCWLLPCAQLISLAWTDPRIWIKIFKKRPLCLLFWLCSFIKLAQNTIVTTTFKLNLSIYEVWLVSYLCFLFQIWYFRKWQIGRASCRERV